MGTKPPCSASSGFGGRRLHVDAGLPGRCLLMCGAGEGAGTGRAVVLHPSLSHCSHQPSFLALLPRSSVSSQASSHSPSRAFRTPLTSGGQESSVIQMCISAASARDGAYLFLSLNHRIS